MLATAERRETMTNPQEITRQAETIIPLAVGADVAIQGERFTVKKLYYAWNAASGDEATHIELDNGTVGFTLTLNELAHIQAHGWPDYFAGNL